LIGPQSQSRSESIFVAITSFESFDGPSLVFRLEDYEKAVFDVFSGFAMRVGFLLDLRAELIGDDGEPGGLLTLSPSSSRLPRIYKTQ